jgi:hypothetical protein
VLLVRHKLVRVGSQDHAAKWNRKSGSWVASCDHCDEQTVVLDLRAALRQSSHELLVYPYVLNMKKCLAIIMLCWSVSAQIPIFTFNTANLPPCTLPQDSMQSYNAGDSVSGLNGGSCWTTAYTIHGY